MRSDLPTLDGPTMAINMGGGSNELRSTSGKCKRLAFTSWVLEFEKKCILRLEILKNIIT